jgi:DNA-binding MarR family transcriptional regulator
VELVIRNNQFYKPIISAYSYYLPNEECPRQLPGEFIPVINAIGGDCRGAAARWILEAAIPISLCVEFLTSPRGNIQPWVGKVPMSHTGKARNAFRPLAHEQRPRCTDRAVKTTPLSGYVGYALRRAQGVIFADFNHTLGQLNLRSGQFAVLLMIDQNPGTSQSSVSAALGIQKANFVATIADLEKRGLVRRRKSDTDGRTYSLGLTPRGRSVLQHAAELQSLHEARVTAQIGNEGRLQLLGLLDRLSALPSAGPLK